MGASSLALPAKPAKLLCVDDDPAIRDLYKRFLAHYGYEVVLAEDGRQALSLFHTKKIDAVVSDYEMPGMTGEELAGNIKRRSPKVPVILVSGCYSVVKEAPRSVDAALSKGTPIKALVDRIRFLLAAREPSAFSRFVPLGSVLASVVLAAFLLPKLWSRPDRLKNLFLQEKRA